MTALACAALYALGILANREALIDTAEFEGAPAAHLWALAALWPLAGAMVALRGAASLAGRRP